MNVAHFYCNRMLYPMLQDNVSKYDLFNKNALKWQPVGTFTLVYNSIEHFQGLPDIGPPEPNL